MGFLRGRVLLWVAAFLIIIPNAGAQSLSRSNAVTHPVPGAAEEALGSFRVKTGFRVELVASEPMVSAPAAMAFDENGRLFVVEMRDYPSQADSRPHLGRIRVLESPDAQGVYQTSTVYAQDLRLPSAIACYNGGVFVGLTPEIRFLKSSNGETGSDIDRVILSGFGGTNAVNPDALLNSFHWGPRHRIYGASGGLAGIIAASNWPGSPVVIERANFSFNPNTLQAEAEPGPTLSGLCFDSFGRQFGCDFDRPLQVAMYPPRYAARNPFYVRPDSMLDAASPATAVYEYAPPGSEQESERGSTPSASRPGASQKSRFEPVWLTHASGCVVYRGHLFPTNYLGSVFVAAPDAHAVHRFVLRDRGLEVTAARALDESQSEFLISEDPSFHPLQIINGPEGALYIADRQEGPERGRIYRVVPQGFKQPKPSALGKARTYDLAALLAQGNGWQMDTAARLLYERQDPATAALLTNMVDRAHLPIARMQALHALEGLGALDEGNVLRGLRDPDPRVREHAVRLSEKLITGGTLSPDLWEQLRNLVADPSISVRCQLAFTLGELRGPDRVLLLAQILLRDPANRWIQNAVLSSVPEGAGSLFVFLAGNASFATDPAGADFLCELAAMIGTKGRLDEVEQAINALVHVPLPKPQAFSLGYALGDGLHRTRSSFALVDQRGALAGLYNLALNVAVDATVVESARVAAVQLVSVSPYTFDEVSDWLLLLCNPQPLPALRLAAVEALGRYNDPRLVPALVERWPAFPPVLRSEAVGVLLSRTNRVGLLIRAVQAGRVDFASFSAAQLNFVRTYFDPALRAAALRLFGPVPLQRTDVIQQFSPALRLHGSADRGRNLFQGRCAGCHQFGGTGVAFGPDLTIAKTRGKPTLLRAILEPSAEIRPQFRTWTLVSNQGENLLGIVLDQNPTTVTLREPGKAARVWPRLNLLTLQEQPWSLMPEGLERGLGPQDMADLLEWLMIGH